MAEKKPALLNRKAFFMIFEAVLCLIVLMLSVRLISYKKVTMGYCVMTSTMFILMSLSDYMKAEYVGKLEKHEYVKRMGYAATFFICSLLVMFGHSDRALKVSAAIYCLTLVYSMIISFSKKKRVIKLILYILLIIFLLLTAFSMVVSDEISPVMAVGVVSICVFLQELYRLIFISLSQIKYKLLLSIATRSLAPQVLSGLVLLIAASSVVLRSEEPGINSYSDALWYCFALVTTIGFGDFTAVTFLGRMISVLLGIYGIIVVAVITSIIVNFYNESKTEEQHDKEAAAEKKEDEAGEQEPDASPEEPQKEEEADPGKPEDEQK